MSNKVPTPDDLQRDDDAGLERLLQEVGARDEPSQAIADEVRHSIHAEWQTVVTARQRRKRFVGFGIAAGVLGLFQHRPAGRHASARPSFAALDRA